MWETEDFWTAAFSPLSGFETRLASPRHRYVTTTFCYGCYLGPAQTAHSVQNLDRFQVAHVNQRHITEQKLLDANVDVINRYNRFMLPKPWGSGQWAAADGTKWDVYEQNLLSEHYIRYGGWGGIGYYHVSHTYIALFSSFIAAGFEKPSIFSMGYWKTAQKFARTRSIRIRRTSRRPSSAWRICWPSS